MNLQDKLMSLSEYNIGFTMYDGNFLISIKYKDSWSIISPEDDAIAFMKDDNNPNVFYYSTPLNDETQHLQHIFDTIDETIAYNKELEQKVELFKQKTEEMQTLFAEKSIEELMTMEFTFKTKRKTTKKANKKKTGKTTSRGCNEEKQPPEVVEEKEETPIDIDKRIEEAMNKKKKTG